MKANDVQSANENAADILCVAMGIDHDSLISSITEVRDAYASTDNPKQDNLDILDVLLQVLSCNQ